jgi:single-strand DNA-binding protein
MIKLQAIGHLGRDAVVNNVNGRTVINFTVAHTEKYKDTQGVQKEKTIWLDCAYWTDRTAVAPYLKKGTQVYVEGQPDVRTYTTQDGKNGASLTVKVLSVQLLGTKNEGQAGGGGYQQQPTNYQQQPSYSAQQPVYQQAPTPVSASELTEPLDDLPF